MSTNINKKCNIDINELNNITNIYNSNNYYTPTKLNNTVYKEKYTNIASDQNTIQFDFVIKFTNRYSKNSKLTQIRNDLIEVINNFYFTNQSDILNENINENYFENQIPKDSETNYSNMLNKNQNLIESNKKNNNCFNWIPTKENIEKLHQIVLNKSKRSANLLKKKQQKSYKSNILLILII